MKNESSKDLSFRIKIIASDFYYLFYFENLNISENIIISVEEVAKVLQD
jgi:hypothetical protein